MSDSSVNHLSNHLKRRVPTYGEFPDLDLGGFLKCALFVHGLFPLIAAERIRQRGRFGLEGIDQSPARHITLGFSRPALRVRLRVERGGRSGIAFSADLGPSVGVGALSDSSHAADF